MEIREVTLDTVDFGDERFRISEELESALLQRSIREVGLQHPVLLMAREDGRYRIITGFRRLYAIANVGMGSFPARLVDSTILTPLEAIRIALWENISYRPLDPLEKARALHILKEIGGVSQEALVRDYLPVFSLAPHRNILRIYLGIHSLLPALRRKFREGEITLASVERLHEYSIGAQERMSAVLRNTRWSASRQREVLQLLDELSGIAEASIEEVLSIREITAILEDSTITSHQRGERIHEALYRLRNPRLSGAVKRFESARDGMGLPGSIRVSPDRYFESPRVRFEFEAGTPEELREAAEALGRAARTPAAESLFRVV